MDMSTTIPGPDGRPRCRWSGAAPEFVAYHDAEWGFPVSDDNRLFEKLCLEGFQSGLSWRTILAKRDLERLLKDDGIVRHRGKIEAVINNARRALETVEREGSLAAFLWRYAPDSTQPGIPQTASISQESTALSKDLKKRGWKFVGPTTAYAFMQAMGLVNDHVEDCVIRTKAEHARRRFRRPGS
jgi:DNA-3-methyladenine glycosylase I